MIDWTKSIEAVGDLNTTDAETAKILDTGDALIFYKYKGRDCSGFYKPDTTQWRNVPEKPPLSEREVWLATEAAEHYPVITSSEIEELAEECPHPAPVDNSAAVAACKAIYKSFGADYPPKVGEIYAAWKVGRDA